MRHTLASFLVCLPALFAAAALGQVSSTGETELLAEAAKRTPIDIQTFESYALSANPAMAEAKALIRRSAAQARQAGLLPNPVAGYQGEQIRGGVYGGGEQGAFVEQTFVLGGKLSLRQGALEERTREDEIGREEQRYMILSDIGQQFYAALAAQETVNIRRRLLGIASDARETAHQLANVGQADAPDVLQSEVEAEQAALDYNLAERTFIQAFHSLAALAGKPELTLTPLAGDLSQLPTIDIDHIDDYLGQNSPSVKRARQDLVRAEAERRSARREVVPDLQIHAGVQNNLEPINNLGNKSVGAQGFVTAGVALPIFNRNQGGIAAAEAEVERARSEVTRVQLTMTRSAQPMIQAYLAARNEAERYRDQMIPRAAQAYRLYLAKYQQMGAAYPEVIVSQRTLFQLQIAYVNALERIWTAAVALQNYMLSDSLGARRNG